MKIIKTSSYVKKAQETEPNTLDVSDGSDELFMVKFDELVQFLNGLQSKVNALINDSAQTLNNIEGNVNQAYGTIGSFAEGQPELSNSSNMLRQSYFSLDQFNYNLSNKLKEFAADIENMKQNLNNI